MKPRTTILLLLLLFGTAPQIRAQYINRVCARDTGHIYRVKGSVSSTFVWTVEGGSIVTDYGDSIKVNWGNVGGEYVVKVQEFSEYDCPALPVEGTVFVSTPLIDLGDDLEICEGESIDINPLGIFSSYLWQDGSSDSSFTSVTEGYIKVIVSDEYGCTNSDSLYLTVHPLPVVDLGPDSSLCGIEELVLDGGNDGVSFLWSTGDIGREITAYEGMGAIWVQVRDMYNCVSYDTIVIDPCNVDERFKGMPNAITPNGDGNNDVWRIPQIDPYPQAIVEIYDRWGIMVYRSEPGYSDLWDGRSSDGRILPMDSYYFVISLNYEGNETITGTVTIIK